jgi:hypothetical protein
MEEYNTAVAKSVVGVLRVDISALVFKDDIKPNKINGVPVTSHVSPDLLTFDVDDIADNVESRLFDSKIVSNLTNIYNESECSRFDPINYVPALISPRELEIALRNSGLTRDDVAQANERGEYPQLILGGKKIFCLKGSHRTKAAWQFPASDYWWSVKLHCFQDSMGSRS